MKCKNNVMILFHGSNQIVKTPKIIIQNRNLDFGHGFYTTLNKKQAEDFAIKVFNFRNSGKPYVNIYEVDNKMLEFFKLKCFEAPNEEWFDFVCNNRQGKSVGQIYDYIYGPVANDDVYTTFKFFEDGVYTKHEALERLKVKKLFNQILFTNEKILKLLKFVEAIEVINEQR